MKISYNRDVIIHFSSWCTAISNAK